VNPAKCQAIRVGWAGGPAGFVWRVRPVLLPATGHLGEDATSGRKRDRIRNESASPANDSGFRPTKNNRSRDPDPNGTTPSCVKDVSASAKVFCSQLWRDRCAAISKPRGRLGRKFRTITTDKQKTASSPRVCAWNPEHRRADLVVNSQTDTCARFSTETRNVPVTVLPQLLPLLVLSVADIK